MKIKKQQIIFYVLLTSLVLPLVCSGAGVTYGNDAISATIKNIIQNIILPIILAVCALMVVGGGLVILTSAGDPGKVGTGRQMIMWAVVGLVIAAIAWALTGLIGGQIVT